MPNEAANKLGVRNLLSIETRVTHVVYCNNPWRFVNDLTQKHIRDTLVSSMRVAANFIMFIEILLVTRGGFGLQQA